jgi:hypothetical protein
MNNWTTGVYTITPAFITHNRHAAVCDEETSQLIAVVGPLSEPNNTELAILIAATPKMLNALLDTLLFFSGATPTIEKHVVVHNIQNASPRLSQPFLAEVRAVQDGGGAQ